MKAVSSVRQFTAFASRVVLCLTVVIALFQLVVPGTAQASIFKNNVRWPLSTNAYTIVPICVIDGSSVTQKGDGASAGFIHEPNPSLEVVVAHVRSALRGSWERWSGARFVGWQKCSTLNAWEQSRSVGLYIHPDADNHASLGTTSKGLVTVANHGVSFKPWGNDFNRCITYNANTTHMEYGFACVEQYAIHEFGHVLGFHHEWRHPARPSGCAAPANEPVITTSYATTYDATKEYTIVHPDRYDMDSIMTYNTGCADVTGVRFGSPNLSWSDQVGANVIYPTPLYAPDEFACDGSVGVYVYAGPNWTGACTRLTGDRDYINRIPSDSASSIRFVGKWEATLYAWWDYTGPTANATTFTADDPNLTNDPIGDNNVASMRVKSLDACDDSRGVYLYAEPNYSGNCTRFTGNDDNLADTLVGTRTASSIGFVGKWEATLYDADRGTSMTFTVEDSTLANDRIGDNRATAISVRPLDACDGSAGVYVYTEQNWTGDCTRFVADDPAFVDDVIHVRTASSIKFVGKWQARLYSWEGANSTFTTDDPYLGDDAIGEDTAAYIKVRSTPEVRLTSSRNPGPVGAPVTLSATVANLVPAAVPGGTVLFLDGATALGRVAVSNGVATFTTNRLQVGTHTINVSYSGDATHTPATATLQQTILLPSITISSVKIAEGSSGTRDAVFTLRLSAASPQVVTVRYATADNSAKAGADYTSRSGTVSFPAQTTTRTIAVPIIGDKLDEVNENFAVNLSNPVNSTIADAQGVGVIMDDDAPPTITISNVTVQEASGSTVNAVFTVQLSQPSSLTVRTNFATADGTARAGLDYSSRAGTLSFAAGMTSREIVITVLGDTLREANETFMLNLSAPVAATIADAQGVAVITNDD